MDKQQPHPAGGAESAEPKAEWMASTVDRLLAGGAEGNAGNDVEGLDGMS